MNEKLLTIILIGFLATFILETNAQITNAERTGFTWIASENVTDTTFGDGYTMYSAAWQMFKHYPGATNFQTGLGSSWLTTQTTGNEPSQFYTTIEGGLGWWGDTRFGTKVPKFIMGGVSHNFFAWANGPAAGRSNNLSNGQRDWSTAGGKYDVAQLSNRLLWAPDGLNMAQSLNGELLGYGYLPMPLSEAITQTAGTNIETGNKCWTLFFNSTNFKGPATFFLPTFWTKPALTDASLENLFLDKRPSNPNVGLGFEHADSPAIIGLDANGVAYAKIERLQFPISGEDNSIVLHDVSVYSKDALWNDMETWFNGGLEIPSGLNQTGIYNKSFINNGGSMFGEIIEFGQNGLDHNIDLTYINPVQQNTNTMGYEFDLNTVIEKDNKFILPEYFKLNTANNWEPVDEANIPASTNLVNTEVPLTPRTEITYLTPKEPDCQFQDPNGPWNNPGPTAGPFYADLGDGSTLTYYWYKFIDQPAVIHANLPNNIRTIMQNRVELIHSNWTHNDEYIAPPTVGNLATIDPKGIVEPPFGLEIGYVPIVTRQQKSSSKVRVFVLAGQSNMQGHGSVTDFENDPGSLVDVIQNDVDGDWSEIGQINNWDTLENAWLYYAKDFDTIRENVTVGQGANSNLIGPELMFAHQLDEYYDDPVLIIKTAWGGKNLAEDFRPPSAGGTTGAFYNEMIQIVQDVTQNLANEFPAIGNTNFEIAGFAWFQGWNDGASTSFLNEYESNLDDLVNDVRTDLGNSELPIVVANSGHGGYIPTNDSWVQSMQNIVAVAQENIGCNDSIYGGNLGFVDTKQYYLDVAVSPFDGVYHYNNNALSFLNIGKAIGDEMILAINDMAFCTEDCGEADQVLSGLVSIGNRVWHDYNRDGINDANEPGIPNVSVLLWSDTDGDGIPDWQGFGGVQITDEEGYYNFAGLQPGPYVTFVWQVNNWDVGEALNGFVSTNGFVADPNNDVDFDNNGFGFPFTDIFSGIVTLTADGEPLNDGDVSDCFFDYDAGGNNSVDFGFYNPNIFVWLGEFDTDWNNANNWSGGNIPNASSNVIIPNGMSNYPEVDQNVSVFSICVEHNASINILPNIIFNITSNAVNPNCNACAASFLDAANDGACESNACLPTITLSANPENQGTYHTANWIISTSKVNVVSGGAVNYYTGNSFIALQNNFEADGSFDFNAEIVPCD